MSENVWYGGQAKVSRIGEKIVKKELRLEYLEIEQARQRLKREIESLLLFDSPRIVKLLEYDSENFSWYTMPYYEDTLEKFYNQIEIEEEIVLNIANKILKAMTDIESKNIVHRDLKPENILLNSIDDLVVCDFGLTKMERDTVLTRTLQGMGTRYFSAPEQFVNAKDVDIRSDIFSFGRILMWLFTKEYTDNINHELIPSKYRSLIRKCVDQSPNERYHSISELKKALDARISIRNLLSRKQILEQIIEIPESYINFLPMPDSELEKFSEEELYDLITKGSLHIWFKEDFDSFDKIYRLWEEKRDFQYKKTKFYPASKADLIGLKFRGYIYDDVPINVKTSLFKKMIHHWGNRYYVMDMIFEIITEGNSDEEFISFLSDSLTDDDIEVMKSFYKQVGAGYDDISPYFLKYLNE